MEAIYSELSNNCFGNPHSRSASSKLTSDLIDQTRAEVLDFFNANKTSEDEYSLIFTSGATASLKLVAESFTFSENEAQSNDHSISSSSFVYLKGNTIIESKSIPRYTVFIDLWLFHKIRKPHICGWNARGAQNQSALLCPSYGAIGEMWWCAKKRKGKSIFNGNDFHYNALSKLVLTLANLTLLWDR